MKKFVIMLVALMCSFTSCDQEVFSENAIKSNDEMVKVVFGYTFNPSEGYSMTRGGQSVFDAFYTHIANGSLIPQDYQLNLVREGDGTCYEITGAWGANNEVSIKNGKYHVTGGSECNPDSVYNLCSVYFDEYISTANCTETGRYDIKANYDCALVIFDNDELEAVYNNNGDGNLVKLPKHGQYFYAFVKDAFYAEGLADKAYIMFDFKDGSVTKVSTASFAPENGKYYVYGAESMNFKTGFTFDLDKMSEGETTLGDEFNDEEEEIVANDGVTCVTTTNAGELSTLITNANEITSLKIQGHIDARDFRFLKWNCENLAYLDISEVIIDKYYGAEGTNEGYNATYGANEIPLGAFFYWMGHYEGDNYVNNDEKHYDEGHHGLVEVVLPKGITAIRRNAFARNYNLKKINFPEGIKEIDYVSFRYCTSLESIELPSTVTEIGMWAFTAVPSLKTVKCAATVPPTINQSFGGLYDADGLRGSVDTNSYNGATDITLYVPNESVDAYKESDWGASFINIIGY